MMKKIDDLIEMEASVRPLIEKMKAELVAKIRTTPVPGVTPISSSVNCFTVNVSTLLSGKPWSAEYYSAESQANIVAKALGNIQTASALKKRLTEMLEKKVVKDSSATHALNDVTLGLISEAIG